MIRRLTLSALICSSTFFTVDLNEADAAWRKGVFRRARANRTRTYRSSRPSQKLHQTHSRSAILDTFSGVYGHDGSWYVGR